MTLWRDRNVCIIIIIITEKHLETLHIIILTDAADYIS